MLAGVVVWPDSEWPTSRKNSPTLVGQRVRNGLPLRNARLDALDDYVGIGGT